MRIKRKTAEALLYLALFATIFTAGYFAGSVQHGNNQPYEQTSCTEVRVRSGDKLWTICREYCPENVDIRSYIARVKAANKMESSVIYPGQVLSMPN